MTDMTDEQIRLWITSATVAIVTTSGDKEIAFFRRFAELARQDEREACAKLCEEASRPYQAAGASVALECAAAIRARGTTTDTTGSKA